MCFVTRGCARERVVNPRRLATGTDAALHLPFVADRVKQRAGVFQLRISCAAFSADPARRAALRRRGEIAAEFSRFSEPDRAVCYRASFRATAQVSANPVD
jgi:hypothetical protein